MKSNEFWGLLINPFRKVAGWQAFGLGLVFVGVMGTWRSMVPWICT